MVILPISSGSLNRVFQARQNTTMPARKVTETMLSSVTSQVVGSVCPMKLRSTLLSAQIR